MSRKTKLGPKPAGWDQMPDWKKEVVDPERWADELAQRPRGNVHDPRTNALRTPGDATPPPRNAPITTPDNGDSVDANGVRTVAVPKATTDDWKTYLGQLNQDLSKVDPYAGSPSASDYLRGYSTILGDEDLRVPGTGEGLAGNAAAPVTQIPMKPAMPQRIQDLRRWWLDASLKGDEKSVRAFQKQLITAGLLDPTDPNYNPGKIYTIKDPTLEAANRLWQMAITQKKNWQDVLANETQSHASQYATGIVKKSTKSDVSLADQDTVRTTAFSVFQKLMGRDPNPGEIAGLTGGLNQAEQANPVVTNTTATTTVDDNANPTTSETSTSAGGVDPAGNILGQVKASYGPEVQQHGENSFMGSLLGILGIGGASGG